MYVLYTAITLWSLLGTGKGVQCASKVDLNMFQYGPHYSMIQNVSYFTRTTFFECCNGCSLDGSDLKTSMKFSL